MKTYAMDMIRNIALIAPHGVGKTSLADAMLHVTGKVGRRGSVDDGSSVFDYSDEEIEKKQTMSASLGWVEVGDTKINIIDTPGVNDFRCDMFCALEIVDGVLFGVKADGGLEVSSDALWRILRERGMPTMIVLTRMNKEHADFDKAIAEFNEHLGGTSVPVQLPIGSGESFKGVVDLLSNKAYEFDADGRPQPVDIPADMAGEAEAAREELMNAAAETDEALIEKFLEDGTLSDEDMLAGLTAGMVAGQVYPVFLTAADSEVGVKPLLDAVAKLIPTPAAKTELKGLKPGTDEETTVEIGSDKGGLAYAFKYQRETQGGDQTWLKVWSGGIKSGDNFSTSNGNSERIGQLSVAMGKGREKVDGACAGDIVLAAKLKNSPTGTTLYTSAAQIQLPAPQLPNPTSAEAITSATAGEEDKMGVGLNKLREEDPSFKIVQDGELSQTLLIGQGEMHLTTVLDRLKKQFGVTVERHRPRVAFKETIKATVEVQGRYKKQTGGRGQFGDVHLRLEPLPRGEDFEFANEIVGGVVPSKFIPAVEKGVRETMSRGVVAGYKMVDMRVALYFGSYHAVDSSENSFKAAARIALKKGVPDAKPTLLEPIMQVTIRVPESYMGDVMGDISSRRGQPQGMEAEGPIQVIKALVPQDEMYQYSTTLRAMTQGTGEFSMEFSHYAEVPGDVARQLIEAYAKSRTEDAD
ncbi:elongation factor G [bacterium]|nr:elongation factor G [bacterium]